MNDGTTSKKGKEKEILSGSYGKKKGCWYWCSGTTTLFFYVCFGLRILMIWWWIWILSHWQVARQLAWQAVVGWKQWKNVSAWFWWIAVVKKQMMTMMMMVIVFALLVCSMRMYISLEFSYECYKLRENCRLKN